MMCDERFFRLFYFIYYHKMVLVPVGDTGQRHLRTQLLEVDLYAHSTKPDTFGSIADTQHADPLARDETPLTERLQGIAAAMVPGHHAQVGRTAVHGVQLEGERKFFDQGFNLFPKLT